MTKMLVQNSLLGNARRAISYCLRSDRYRNPRGAPSPKPFGTFSSSATGLISSDSSDQGDSGASCPIGYGYKPERIAAAADVETDILYVVGGLYGNPFALEAIEARAMLEAVRPLCIFNGDFNFFNKNDFATVNNAISQHHLASAGNVELEISSERSGGGGCGCSYPNYVSAGVVDRSDAIVAALGRAAAQGPPSLRHWLRTLPLFRTFRVGGVRLAAIHGDPENLAGWALGVERMEPPDTALRTALGCPDGPTTPSARIRAWLAAANVRLFACAHTCLPFAQRFRDADGGGGAGNAGGGAGGAVFNSGAAGLPCFAGTAHGLMTRVAADPRPPADSLYGCELRGPGGAQARVDCVPVRYDAAAFRAWFLAQWPPGSPAHESYFGRIAHGPAGFSAARANRLHVP